MRRGRHREGYRRNRRGLQESPSIKTRKNTEQAAETNNSTEQNIETQVSEAIFIPSSPQSTKHDSQNT